MLSHSTPISSVLPQGLDVGPYGNTLGFVPAKLEGFQSEHLWAHLDQSGSKMVNSSPFPNPGAQFGDTLTNLLGRALQSQALSPSRVANFITHPCICFSFFPVPLPLSLSSAPWLTSQINYLYISLCISFSFRRDLS